MSFYFVISFIVLTLGFYLAEKALTHTNFNLRRWVKSRFKRYIVILLLFVIAVHFNIRWRDYRDIISLYSLMNVFCYGIFLKLLIHCMWSKVSN